MRPPLVGTQRSPLRMYQWPHPLFPAFVIPNFMYRSAHTRSMIIDIDTFPRTVRRLVHLMADCQMTMLLDGRTPPVPALAVDRTMRESLDIGQRAEVESSHELRFRGARVA